MTDPWKLLTEEEAEDLIASLPADWLKGSDDDSIERTSRRLEESDDIDENILEILAYSPYWRIRRAVALSPSCSSTFIERLKQKKVKDYFGLNPDEIIHQAIRDRSIPPEWRIEDTDLLIEKIGVEEVPVPVLEALAQHDYPSVLEAVVRAPGVTQSILDKIHQRCIESEPAYRFAGVLAVISEKTSNGSTDTHSSAGESTIVGSKELIATLEPDILQLIFNSLAVAGVEDVIGRDQSEVWTLLGEDEPQGYDYGDDSHTEIIERATGMLAQELGDAFHSDYEKFDTLIHSNDGYLMFWEKLMHEDIDIDIDSFSEALDRILEDIS